MIPIVSLFSSESRDPSYVGLAKCPVCSRKHWRDTSCWIHPRESVMPNSTLKNEKVSWILSGKFFFMHWKIPHNFTRFTSGSKLLFFHQVVSNRGGSTGADPRGRSAHRKTYESNLFHHDLYNSENSIRSMRLFYRPLFCHSSVVTYTSLLLQ